MCLNCVDVSIEFQDLLIGNPQKAKEKLGWEAKIKLKVSKISKQINVSYSDIQSFLSSNLVRFAE